MSISPEAPHLDDSSTSGAEESRTASLLQGLQSGSIHAKSISIADRRQIVSVLLAEGHSTADIAQIMKLSDRSIERDKLAIRQGHAIQRDPKLIPQMVGRLVCEADLSIQRMRKAARDKSAPVAVKVEAEHRCYQVISDVVQRMQSLGYLPTAMQRMQADLVHHVGDVPDYDQLHAEVKRIKQIRQHSPPASDGEQPGKSDALQRIEKIEVEITRARLASQIDELASDCDPELPDEPTQGEMPDART